MSPNMLKQVPAEGHVRANSGAAWAGALMEEGPCILVEAWECEGHGDWEMVHKVSECRIDDVEHESDRIAQSLERTCTAPSTLASSKTKRESFTCCS